MSYEQWFHQVVICGLVCGLPTPAEWLLNDQLHFTNIYSYEDITLIQGYWEKFSKEMVDCGVLDFE